MLQYILYQIIGVGAEINIIYLFENWERGREVGLRSR